MIFAFPGNLPICNNSRNKLTFDSPENVQDMELGAVFMG
jgi:hypothetical protein